jgi:hypothetical protein
MAVMRSEVLSAVAVSIAILCAAEIASAETATCDRSCRMDLSELDAIVEKIEREPDIAARTELAEKLMQLVRKDPTRPYSPSLVGRVSNLLDDPADSVRYWVATALGLMGPKASAALPKLERALQVARKIKATKTSEAAIRIAIQRIREPH